MCISVPLHSDKTSPSALLEELLFLPRSLGGSEIQSFSSLFVFKVSLSKTFRLGGHLHNNVHNPQEPPHPKTPQRLSVCGKSTANNWMSSQECIPKECWRVTGNSGRRFLFVCFFLGGFSRHLVTPFFQGCLSIPGPLAGVGLHRPSFLCLPQARHERQLRGGGGGGDFGRWKVTDVALLGCYQPLKASLQGWGWVVLRASVGWVGVEDGRLFHLLAGPSPVVSHWPLSGGFP